MPEFGNAMRTQKVCARVRSKGNILLSLLLVNVIAVVTHSSHLPSVNVIAMRTPVVSLDRLRKLWIMRLQIADESLSPGTNE